MLGAVLAGALLGAHTLSTSTAQLTDTQSLSGNNFSTRTACALGPTYANAVLAMSPTFYWRMGELEPPSVTTIADSSPNGTDGSAKGTGLSFGPGNNGLIECDDTHSARFDGSATSDGFLVQPTAVMNPDVFTISTWIRTTSNQGGWILGMGSARWGTSVNRDRVLYLQDNGRPAFSVGIGPRTTVEGTTPINDDLPHLLVATLDANGASLFVDGVQVAFDPTISAGASYTGNESADPPPPAVLPTADGFGYWRIGYDSTAGLGPSAPTRNQIDARIDEVAVWQDVALTPAEVSELYAQNHW